MREMKGLTKLLLLSFTFAIVIRPICAYHHIEIICNILSDGTLVARSKGFPP